MPKGPRGEKRPADAIGNAIRVARIATGEEPEDLEPGRVAAGRKGGMARAAGLTDAQRVEAAKLAAQARWKRGPAD